MTPHPLPELFLLVKPSEIAILMSYSKTIVEKAETLQIIDSRSHTPQQSGRDVKELFRKEIAKWKDEDPLFMAYVYGQEAGTAEECEKNLELIEKEINEYTEYWLQQSGYTVLLYLQNELRQSKDGE